MEIWDWLGNNKNQLTVLIALIPVIWAVIQYLWSKRQEIKHRQFETYHSLIKSLVQREDKNQPMQVDRQIAIIFELRNHKSYYPVTLRILNGLKEEWEESEGKHHRIHMELDESIKFIEDKI